MSTHDKIEELQKEVKTWSKDQKETFLERRNALFILSENGTGGVADGTSSDVTDVDYWIASKLAGRGC